ncbi:MAG: beta-ketoacyl-ACP synthase II [Bacteroidota bacterium]|nr:beta-ketoacyl-ACP synthase II [Bacteroidota bacterium]
MNYRRVVVTGIGLITPLGHTIDEFWKNLESGFSSADNITRFDAEKFKTQFACEVKNFNPKDYLDRKELRKSDLFSQYAMVSADNAIKDSGLDLEKIDKERAGVIWASGIGGITALQEEISNFAKGDGTPRFSPFFIPKMIIDLAAGNISIKYGFHGVNFATVSACASSSNAIGSAYEYIRYGRVDVMVAGGSEASISPIAVGGFNSMKAMSVRNDDPKTASRPFDRDRDGFVIGEGGVGFILEEYEHAKKRGATIYAEIAGSGYSADGYHITAPHPEGLGASLVMKNVLKDAEINPEKIDYINVHGTATPRGDISETIAIKDVFADNAYKLNISSTKSMHGHLLGAAGAIEGLVCILAMRNNIVPPTINQFNRDPEIDSKLNLTKNDAQQREINYALSNTFGFGGHNVSLLYKKLEAK